MRAASGRVCVFALSGNAVGNNCIIKKKRTGQDMSCGMREIYHCALNEGFSSKFPVVYPNRYSPDEDRKVPRSKRCDNNKQDGDNCSHINTADNDNYSSPKFRQRLYQTWINAIFPVDFMEVRFSFS